MSARRDRMMRTNRLTPWTWLVVSLAALLVLGGCQLARGLVAGERPGLGAWNDTDLSVDIVVNGESLGAMGPGMGMEVASTWRMPALPWQVEARTETGRVLLAMTVTADDLAASGFQRSGVALPCGRLLVWAGVEPVDSPAWEQHTGTCEP